MLTRMGKHGRVACCGAVSAYDAGSAAEPIRNWGEVISQRIQLRGFIIFDALPKFGEYTRRLIKAYQEGKLTIGDENETVVKVAFDDVPKTWMSLVSLIAKEFDLMLTILVLWRKYGQAGHGIVNGLGCIDRHTSIQASPYGSKWHHLTDIRNLCHLRQLHPRVIHIRPLCSSVVPGTPPRSTSSA